MRNIAEKPTNLQGMLADLIYWGYTGSLLSEKTHLCDEQITSIFNGNNNLAFYRQIFPIWCEEYVRQQKINAADLCDAYNSPQYENYADIRGGEAK